MVFWRPKPRPCPGLTRVAAVRCSGAPSASNPVERLRRPIRCLMDGSLELEHLERLIEQFTKLVLAVAPNLEVRAMGRAVLGEGADHHDAARGEGAAHGAEVGNT